MHGTFNVFLCLQVPVCFHKFDVLKVKSPEGVLTVHLTCTDKLEFITEYSNNHICKEKEMWSSKCGSQSGDVIIAAPIYTHLYIQIHTYRIVQLEKAFKDI